MSRTTDQTLMGMVTRTREADIARDLAHRQLVAVARSTAHAGRARRHAPFDPGRMAAVARRALVSSVTFRASSRTDARTGGAATHTLCCA